MRISENHKNKNQINILESNFKFKNVSYDCLNWKFSNLRNDLVGK